MGEHPARDELVSKLDVEKRPTKRYTSKGVGYIHCIFRGVLNSAVMGLDVMRGGCWANFLEPSNNNNDPLHTNPITAIRFQTQWIG